MIKWLKPYYSFAGWAWLLVIISLAAYSANALWTPGKIQFDLLALLPESKTQKMLAANQLMVDANLSGRIVILLGDENPVKAKQAITKLRHDIIEQNLPIKEQDAKTIANDYKQLFTDLFPYRAGLLAKTDQQLLEQGQGAVIANRAIASITSPFGAPQVNSDPFGLYQQYVISLNSAKSMQLDGYNLFIKYGKKTWYVFQAHITQPVFSLRLQEEMTGKLSHIFHELPVEILKTGSLFYAAAGATQAKTEISEIGLLSVLGIIFLLFFVFRTPRPLLLAMAVVTSGLVGGLATCLYFFGMIHILALVFGCSLVGVAVDYALHYFCASYQKNINRFDVLRTLMPALPLGVLSSSVGYGLLVVAPFPGIQQMAILACVGLLCTFISVCLWGPYFIKPLKIPAIGEKIQTKLEKLASLGHKKYARLILSAALILVFAAGSLGLKFDDNVRSFQSLDVGLEAQEKRIKSMMKFDNSSKFLAVTGNNLEEVLRTEEQLMVDLDKLKVPYKALAELIPSQERQKQNSHLRAKLYKEQGSKVMAVLGLKKLPDAAAKPLSHIKNLPSGWKELAHYDPNNKITGRVILHGAVDTQLIDGLITKYQGVSFIDPVHEYSQLFASYREIMMYLILCVLLGIALILALRHGICAASMVTLPVSLSIMASVGIISLLGMSFTLFHAMGLMLVLCIGIDYALFLYWRTSDHNKGGLLLLGNGLAAVTTILSFGLLALSKTNAVHSFGLSVFIGIVLCFFITTLFLGKYRGQHD